MITKTTQYCKNQKLSKAISYVTGSEFIVEAHARETVARASGLIGFISFFKINNWGEYLKISSAH